jgi:hypothetical protein
MRASAASIAHCVGLDSLSTRLAFTGRRDSPAMKGPLAFGVD